MDELERSVVQICEARRLASWGDVPHGRLALLLLDNVVEVSLRRTAETDIGWAEMYNNMAYNFRDVDPDDSQGQKLKAEIEAKTISKKRRNQVRRNFDALVDFVFGQKDFALRGEYAECLKILHRYRNVAYHRDIVRAEVLGPAVQILFFLSCHLLKSERQVLSIIKEAPQAVLEIFGGNSPDSPLSANIYDANSLAGKVADKLLADLKLDHQGIAGALSGHLVARIDGLVKDLDQISANIPPGLSRSVTLRLVQQAPREPEEFEAELPDDFWDRPLPVTEEVIDSWFVGARSLRDVPIAHDALRAFAGIERPLEAVEEPVARFIRDLDYAEQRRLDELWGK